MKTANIKLIHNLLRCYQWLLLASLPLILATLCMALPKSANRRQFDDSVRQKTELVVQTGHTFAVDKLAFSPTGNLIASLSWKDGVAKIWSVKDAKEVKRIELKKNYSSPVPSMAINDAGSRLAFGFFDGSIVVYDLLSGKNSPRLSKVQENEISSLSFSDTGDLIVSGEADGTATIWDIKPLVARTRLAIPKDFTSIEFAPGGKSLVVVTNRDVSFWNAVSGSRSVAIRCGQGTVVSAAVSQNSSFLGVICEESRIEVFNLKSGKIEQVLYESDFDPTTIAFSRDSSTLVAADSGSGRIQQWEVKTGKRGSPTNLLPENLGELTLVPNGNGLISVGQVTQINKTETTSSCDNETDAFSSLSKGERTFLKLLNINDGMERIDLSGRSSPMNQLILTTDKKLLITLGGYQNDSINIFQMSDRILRTIQLGSYVSALTVSEDGRMMAAGDASHGIKIFDPTTGEELQSLNGHTGEVRSLAFGVNGKYLISYGNDKRIILWDLENRNQRVFETCSDLDAESMAISPENERIAALDMNGRIKVWNLRTADVIRRYQDDQLKGLKVTFSVDGDTLVFQNPENRTVSFPNGIEVTRKDYGELLFRDFDEKAELFSLILLDGGYWVVKTPDGRFDTNKSLDLIKGLHWIVDDKIFNPLPLEVFLRDYYEPNLLSRLLKCNEEGNCDVEFKPIRNLTELNRTQPLVKIADIKPTGSKDVVRVTVEAKNVLSEYQKDKQNKPLRSGLADLRLFRDGQLVGYAPDSEGAVRLDAKGKFTKTFDVTLPKNIGAKEFSFTAYAFNVDRVKSETASLVYTLPKPLPVKKGLAYIVTIGVNANSNAGLRLRYAANDARRLQEEIAKNLPKDKYEDIVQIPMISDYDSAGNLTENTATKAKIKAVLDKLSGKTVAADAFKDVPMAEMLRKVEPEDLVLIAFSGHGYADREGVFYLVPYDVGARAEIVKNSISSDDLSLWLRDIDAGEMMMIVDACHSAAAVQGKDFKPGPMGSRGLGQLSYDKGMRILTATQADNVALELGNLQHGLLTYSLIKNGIELGLADTQPKDSKLFSNEWLGFAVQDVPSLYEKISKGEIKGLTVNGEQKRNVTVVDLEGNQKTNLNLQQPSLFDFNRRKANFEFLNLASK